MKYCISDVQILKQACLKFCQQLMEISNVCPFTEASTIASASNIAFRRNFLNAEKIGIIPKRGYRCKDNHFKIAVQWLTLEEKCRNININHALKGSECRIVGVKVSTHLGIAKRLRKFLNFKGVTITVVQNVISTTEINICTKILQMA